MPNPAFKPWQTQERNVVIYFIDITESMIKYIVLLVPSLKSATQSKKIVSQVVHLGGEEGGVPLSHIILFLKNLTRVGVKATPT